MMMNISGVMWTSQSFLVAARKLFPMKFFEILFEAFKTVWWDKRQ